ncbi:uncharacterized protein [Malus domestica]|uniref:uncharacterized protein n=1 Tax=Malus domestica TaxID=3750 RepID=UPI0039769952
MTMEFKLKALVSVIYVLSFLSYGGAAATAVTSTTDYSAAPGAPTTTPMAASHLVGILHPTSNSEYVPLSVCATRLVALFQLVLRPKPPITQLAAPRRQIWFGSLVQPPIPNMGQRLDS